MTLTTFAWVIVTFVRWVDNIARLGRLGNTIEKVEQATNGAFSNYTPMQSLGGAPDEPSWPEVYKVFSDNFGYVQHIDMKRLQDWAEANHAHIQVLALPGSFVARSRLSAVINSSSGGPGEVKFEIKEIAEAFVMASTRSFSDDPRFGLIVLAEIASRALSPGVNDQGTAIDIINRLGQIILKWDDAARSEESPTEPDFDRVHILPLLADDLMEDGFTPITRDGAGTIEVGVKLQKTFAFLAQAKNPGIQRAAIRHVEFAYQRAKEALTFPQDLVRLDEAAKKLPVVHGS